MGGGSGPDGQNVCLSRGGVKNLPPPFFLLGNEYEYIITYK